MRAKTITALTLLCSESQVLAKIWNPVHSNWGTIRIRASRKLGGLVLGKASKEDRTISDRRGSQPHRGQDSRLRSEIQVCQLSKRLSVTASR